MATFSDIAWQPSTLLGIAAAQFHVPPGDYLVSVKLANGTVTALPVAIDDHGGVVRFDLAGRVSSEQ